MIFEILLDIIRTFLTEWLVLVVLLATIRFSLWILYSVFKYLFSKHTL